MGSQLALDTHLQSVAWSMSCFLDCLPLERRNDVDVKGGGAATAPGGEENIRRPGLRVRHDTGGFTGWSQGRRLGGGKDDITDGVVTEYPITISSTANLMIAILICSAGAFRAGVWGTVKRDAQPVPQTTPKFLVLEV